MTNLQARIINSLTQIKGNSFASMDLESTVKLKGGKKNEMQGRITKKTTGGSVQLFNSSNGYRNKLQKLATKNGLTGKVELKKRPWGIRRQDAPIVEHNGSLYVEFIWDNMPQTEYFLDGKHIDKSDVIGLESKTMVKGEKPILRVSKLENIRSLKMGKLSV